MPDNQTPQGAVDVAAQSTSAMPTMLPKTGETSANPLYSLGLGFVGNRRLAAPLGQEKSVIDMHDRDLHKRT